MKRSTMGIIALLFIFALVGCSGNGVTSATSDQVIKAFQDAGLEAENVTDLPNKEFGNTREEGKRILVPTLGDDAGGRLFKFKSESDLEQAKSYYDELGKSSPMFYSHTYAIGGFLLQMNGDMEDAEFDKYKKVMDEVIK